MQETRSSANNENAEAIVDMLDYCGTLQDIIKVGFRKFDIFIFDVKWFKVVTQGPQGTVRKDKSGFLQVDRTKIWTDQRDTFVLPEHCEQVIFKEDPTDRRWLFVIQIDPHGRKIYEDVGIEGENFPNTEEMIPPNNAPIELGGVTHKYVSVSRGFNRRDFLIPFFTHFLHTEGCHLKGVFTVE